MEQLNLGCEAVKSSRRFSSILKASRTSMKEVGAEQEEQQEEVTKPIEKKRNSRRVSFATTNNVRVFSNDAKSESPVLASIQNTTVRDGRQDQKILHFGEEGNHQIKGLETLLNNPLYVSQHLNKENFFSDPLLQDDCVDRTMLLGEDTGFMDITHSHTITIDNDYEVDEESKPDFGLKVAQTLSRNQNIASQSGLSCSAKVVTKNDTMDPDFNAFLTSISQPNVKNIVPSSSKVELGKDTGDMDITQSNTIIIDRDFEIYDHPNLEVVGGNQNVASKTWVSCEAKIETNSTVDSDFNAFLASISLPAEKNIAPPSSKKRLGGLFSSVNTGSSEIDEENLLPLFLEKQVQHLGGKGNPQQPRGLQRRRSRVAFLVDDDMEATTSHTVVIEKDKHFDVIEHNSNCETVNINDEEFPEMSSEEDLSRSLESWPVNKKDECSKSLTEPINDETFEDVFESDTNKSQGFKRSYKEEGYVTEEPTKKAYISEMGLACHEAAVQWEGNFPSHSTQNHKAKTIEETGVFESTFRNSQCDSHLDGTMNHEFDFNKKLEDGSITVNEFLSHFGINFVIHRSRPSALPESFRAGETLTMEDLLKERYIHHPKQRVYEQDCKNLTDTVEKLKEQMPEQEKSLRYINGALQQEICTLSKVQLKRFGSKLKERRVYFGKRSKALSHEMKGVLYSELIKTTQDAKQSLISKIKETDEMMAELDGCINDLETAVEAVIMGDHHNTPQSRPALKAKEEGLQSLHSAVTEKEREIAKLEIQLKTLEGQQHKLREETRGLKSNLTTLNSLNEWRLHESDESGALFTFLHNTVHLQVKLQTPAGKEWMTEDVVRKIDISFQLQLDVDKSECHASMVHKLLALHHRSQTQWAQRYPTTRHIPELLHDLSLAVGRLRLLGEEIHRLKKCGGLKLRILRINCVDTQVHIIFSSVKAFEKFELILRITPDYPFGPLEIQDFSSHVGNTRFNQIKDIISSVKPANNYLTKVLKKIYDDLLS
ncbi:kinetochore scaffold 1-like [Myxocyprinus asiaticus]|uniref:kinetochore scaffold 1-like n=1 Tax=Myxocyprinus asiaticus TaxID=70543 RepID=UPI002223C0E5|nr:kinetochore scaffold 1-like [Myxocyprinus asiaticus]